MCIQFTFREGAHVHAAFESSMNCFEPSSKLWATMALFEAEPFWQCSCLMCPSGFPGYDLEVPERLAKRGCKALLPPARQAAGVMKGYLVGLPGNQNPKAKSIITVRAAIVIKGKLGLDH